VTSRTATTSLLTIVNIETRLVCLLLVVCLVLGATATHEDVWNEENDHTALAELETIDEPEKDATQKESWKLTKEQLCTAYAKKAGWEKTDGEKTDGKKTDGDGDGKMDKGGKGGKKMKDMKDMKDKGGKKMKDMKDMKDKKGMTTQDKKEKKAMKKKLKKQEKQMQNEENKAPQGGRKLLGSKSPPPPPTTTETKKDKKAASQAKNAAHQQAEAKKTQAKAQAYDEKNKKAKPAGKLDVWKEKKTVKDDKKGGKKDKGNKGGKGGKTVIDKADIKKKITMWKKSKDSKENKSNPVKKSAEGVKKDIKGMEQDVLDKITKAKSKENAAKTKAFGCCMVKMECRTAVKNEAMKGEEKKKLNLIDAEAWASFAHKVGETGVSRRLLGNGGRKAIKGKSIKQAAMAATDAANTETDPEKKKAIEALRKKIKAAMVKMMSCVKDADATCATGKKDWKGKPDMEGKGDKKGGKGKPDMEGKGDKDEWKEKPDMKGKGDKKDLVNF